MFGSIDIKTRPLRLAYLVQPNNAAHVREAIRLSSTLWGGANFPIIPLHKRMPFTWRQNPLETLDAKSVILGYLNAFDPDILVQFAEEVPRFVVDSGIRIVNPDEIWKVSDGEQRDSPLLGIGVFELLDQLFDDYFKYKQKYPVRVVVPKLPSHLPLFWASVLGELPSNIQATVQRRYADAIELETPDFDPDKWRDLLAGNVLFPRRISQYGLTSINRSFGSRDARLLFLDATKVEDIIDYWNLGPLSRDVLPVPRQLVDSAPFREMVVTFLKQNRRPWKHDPTECDFASFIRARNCTMEEMQAYAQTIKIDLPPGDESHGSFFALQHWYPRVWDEWARDKDGAVPVDTYGDQKDPIEFGDTKDLMVRFRPRLPSFADKHGYHGEPRCANEFEFHLYGSEEYIAEVFPKSSGENLTRAISSLTASRGDWRVGNNGLVRLVRDDFSETRAIPSAESIVFSWLKDKGWKAQLSPPGLLAKHIYRSLSGFPSILKNEKLLGLFERMNGGTVKADESPTEENKVTHERDLPVGEVKNKLRAIGKRSDLYNYLTCKGIFKLGARIQCSSCVRHSWFPLESIRESFTCPKCLNIFSAIGNLDSATWSYKTAGPFSVPQYADGAYAVLLTVELFHRTFATLRTTPVLSFTAEAPNKQNIEADYAMLWQESVYGEKSAGILFGECKTYGCFGEKDFARMRHLAKLFPGAVLAFSTLRRSLTETEIRGITKIAKAGRKYWKSELPLNPVMILTGTELLGGWGPPYCWEESEKKKFQHVRGLLGVCDVTQQIYLQLPSWQTEWHDNRERKRQRRRQAMKDKLLTDQNH